MSAEYRSKSVQIASKGIAENGVSGRRFATLLTGGALVLALVLGAAMPAKADKKDDLAKALVAALAIGVFAHELKDKPKPTKVKQTRVPSTCAISIDGAKKSVTLYSENCLKREGFSHRLPRGCANNAQIFGKHDRVYSTQCLQDAGFRISDR